MKAISYTIIASAWVVAFWQVCLFAMTAGWRWRKRLTLAKTWTGRLVSARSWQFTAPMTSAPLPAARIARGVNHE